MWVIFQKVVELTSVPLSRFRHTGKRVAIIRYPPPHGPRYPLEGCAGDTIARTLIRK